MSASAAKVIPIPRPQQGLAPKRTWDFTNEASATELPMLNANTGTIAAESNYFPGISKFLSEPESYGDTVTTPSREEFDAKLATVEARAETRFVELSGKIDRVADSVASLTTTVSVQLNEVRSDNKYTRWTIVIAVVTSLIAGIAALWITQANLLSAFQTGISMRSDQPSAPVPQKKGP